MSDTEKVKMAKETNKADEYLMRAILELLHKCATIEEFRECITRIMGEEKK